MPHVVIGDPLQREAQVRSGNEMAEHYLGVWLANSPDELLPGEAADVDLVLMYWPEEQYEGLTPGATFTVREGPLIVGFGQVLGPHHSDVRARDSKTRYVADYGNLRLEVCPEQDGFKFRVLDNSDGLSLWVGTEPDLQSAQSSAVFEAQFLAMPSLIPLTAQWRQEDAI